MAPTTQIETVTVVRPLKVMALICGVIGIILGIIAVASTHWLEADGYLQGLWNECVWEDGVPMTCSRNPHKAWIAACAGLSIICLIFAAGATLLCGLGLFTKNPDTKFKFYRLAMYIMFFAIVLLVIALIIFPIMFMQEIRDRGKPEWYFAWAYGVAWGSGIFLFGAAILLLIDKESEEIYYREKTYYERETNA